MVEREQKPGDDAELVDFVAGIAGETLLRIEESLPHGFVRLKVAEAERRQAQHDIRSVEDIVTELVRNSRDAGARRVFVATQKESGRYRRISVLDDGAGIPDEMHQMVFEPRVTSKRDAFSEDRYGVHGRGMALFSIRSRAREARFATSIPGRGTSITVTADTQKVPERTDQATFPSLVEKSGVVCVGPGPHNVARVLTEMSIDHPEMEFYLGSFSEVLATLIDEASRESEQSPWSFLEGVSDARKLAASADDYLGLPISERNAYRILAGQIAPLETVRETAGRRGVAVETADRPVEKKEGVRAPRGGLARVSKDDLAEVGEGARSAAERVLKRYYLVAGPARVRRSRGRMNISFPVTEEEE